MNSRHIDSNEKPYAIVVFGATGFTGRLVAEYLARTVGNSVSWAIAGRSRAKLEALRSDLAAVIDPDCASIGIIEADVGDAKKLSSMAAATRVLLSTVGPYARYGEPVVDAAVEHRCDYVDITGEPDFVDAMVKKHHTEASARGLRIVNACGFDSVPHDLGVLYTVSRLPEGVPLTIEGFVRSSGSPSGGTWHSAVEFFSKHTPLRGSRRPEREATNGRLVRGLHTAVHREPALDSWAVPLPTIDPVVVLRSAAMIDRYGPDFRYGHNAQVKYTTTLLAAGAGLGAVIALSKFKPTRELLLSLKSPGDGPSIARRKRSWFTVRFRGSGGGQTLWTKVSGGDPGYTETSKMLAESALCLALDRGALPVHTGVITPAAAMGEALIERLQRAGIRFEVIDSPLA